jgi:hypothetical protein
MEIRPVGAALIYVNRWTDRHDKGVISGFHRDVDEICALLGYYAVLSGSSVLTFWDNLSVPSSCVEDFLTIEYGTDCLSKNFGTELPLNTV